MTSSWGTTTYRWCCVSRKTNKRFGQPRASPAFWAFDRRSSHDLLTGRQLEWFFNRVKTNKTTLCGGSYAVPYHDVRMSIVRYISFFWLCTQPILGDKKSVATDVPPQTRDPDRWAVVIAIEIWKSRSSLQWNVNTSLEVASHCDPEIKPNVTLQWRHNGLDSVSNHQPHQCLLSHLFGRRSKKTSKLRVTGLCARNSPGTGEFPARMASYAENVSIWWRHHVINAMTSSKKHDNTMQHHHNYHHHQLQ